MLIKLLLDTITIRSFENIRHLIGVGYLYENEDSSIGNGFLLFPKGHQLLLNGMHQFANEYNPNIWAVNGPVLFKVKFK